MWLIINLNSSLMQNVYPPCLKFQISGQYDIWSILKLKKKKKTIPPKKTCKWHVPEFQQDAEGRHLPPRPSVSWPALCPQSLWLGRKIPFHLESVLSVQVSIPSIFWVPVVALHSTFRELNTLCPKSSVKLARKIKKRKEKRRRIT